MNDALLCKWLWRYQKEPDAKWRNIIKDKYGESKLKWDTKVTKLKYDSGIWRGVTNRMKSFYKGILHKVGKGDRTSFWEDHWLGDMPLKTTFPNLCNVSRNKNNVVNQFYSSDSEGHSNWNLDLRRRLSEIEIAETGTYDISCNT